MKKIIALASIGCILASCSQLPEQTTPPVQNATKEEKVVAPKTKDEWQKIPQITRLRVENNRYVKWDKYPKAVYYRMVTAGEDGDRLLTFDAKKIEKAYADKLKNEEGILMYDYLTLAKSAREDISKYTQIIKVKIVMTALDGDKKFLATTTLDTEVLGKPTISKK